MRILVCGGRDFQDYDFLKAELDEIHARHPISLLIHGGAKGADTLSGRWAKENGIAVKVFKADWETYGKAAGFRRNQLMLDKGQPDLVFAFPGGKGTADMVTRARRAKVETVVA